LKRHALSLIPYVETTKDWRPKPVEHVIFAETLLEKLARIKTLLYKLILAEYPLRTATSTKQEKCYILDILAIEEKTNCR